MKATFEIEWNEDLGEGWMNVWNLQACIDSVCKPGLCRVIRQIEPTEVYQNEPFFRGSSKLAEWEKPDD